MQARLPTRAGQWLKTTEVSWPKCPKKWAAQESLMKKVVDMSREGTSCLVRDDKNQGMMWLVEKTELIHHIDLALTESPDWTLCKTTSGDQKAKVWAWTNVSFPN